MYIYENTTNLVTVNKLHAEYELLDCYDRDMYQHHDIINGKSVACDTSQIIAMKRVDEITEGYADYLEGWTMKVICSYNHTGVVPVMDDNTIFALDVTLRCMNSDTPTKKNITKWIEDSIQWLNTTFGQSPDGLSNVFSVVLYQYKDFAAPPMLRAMVIPIDKGGNFETEATIDKRFNERVLNDSYLKAHNVTRLKR